MSDPSPDRRSSIFVFDDGEPPLSRATVADPFRVRDDGTVAPRVDGADYRIVTAIEDADIAALPAHWDNYVGRARQKALDAVDRAASNGLKTIIWVVGDSEAVFSSADIVAFHLGPNRQRPGRPNPVESYPVFIEDRRDAVAADATGIGVVPRIGFCGQGATTAAEELRRLGRKVIDHGLARIGRRDRYAEPLRSHIRLRERALQVVQKSTVVDADVLIRRRYRGGVVDRNRRLDPAEPTNVEFVRNIRTTDYTLCVRGGGNFSARLYEVLMHGRIPVIVDSGARLPLEDQIDWNDLAVIVGESDLDDLPEIVRARHDRVGPEGITAWHDRCRQTWVERLSLDGYFSRFGATSRRHHAR